MIGYKYSCIECSRNNQCNESCAVATIVDDFSLSPPYLNSQFLVRSHPVNAPSLDYSVHHKSASLLTVLSIIICLFICYIIAFLA